MKQNLSLEVFTMSFPLLMPQWRRIGAVAAAALFAAGVVQAQSTTPNDASSSDTSSSSSYSSSQSGLTQTELAEFSLPESLTPRASSSSSGGAGQYAAGEKHSVLHSWAFEAGGGFNAPISNSVTYGGQFTVGAGLRFNKYLSTLAEYQFLDSKLPGYLIAEAGANGGYAHIWSLTIDPVIDLMPKATNDVYVTGGGGFYRKVTSFTDPEETEYCYYFCEIGTVNAVVGHFSSNQGGINFGAGFQHRVGGMSGDGNMKLFVEARYVDVFSPAVVGSANGLGVTSVAANTKVIPVSVGIRF
jgi:Outer membrane protein beta-barrel domain